MATSKEHKNRYDKARYQANKPKVLEEQLRRHGLTVEQYKAFGNNCMICNGKSAKAYGGQRRLSVDHDHTTKKVRGILCDNCNMGLGKFKDSVFLLSAAIAYLWRHHKDEDTYCNESLKRSFTKCSE